MGQGGGGGVPRQHPSSGHLAVADTWAPPRAAWLSPCPCWLSRGRTPAPGPPTVPSAPWRPALCRRPALGPRASAGPTCPLRTLPWGPRPMPPAALPPPRLRVWPQPHPHLRQSSSPAWGTGLTLLPRGGDRPQLQISWELPWLHTVPAWPAAPRRRTRWTQETRWPRGRGGHGDKVATGDPRRCLSCSCSSLQLGVPNGLALAPAGRAGPCRLSPSRVP